MKRQVLRAVVAFAGRFLAFFLISRDRVAGKVLRAYRRLRAPGGYRDGDLALVIPVHNDADDLARLLVQVRALGVFSQIVVVDDGSDTPVLPMPGVDLLRHPVSRGGGAARNTGLAAVTRPYVLFFDSDDVITPAFRDLLCDLDRDARPFDFCLFKYADSRVIAEGVWGQPDWDEVFWDEAGLTTGALAEALVASLPILAQTANYPWNKVFRTAFLRDHNIGCAETVVHQDIPLHWLAFIAAGRVLVSDRVCALHYVRQGAGRLSNRRGVERLQVFDALTPVALAARRAGGVWPGALMRFVPGLFDWVAGQIDPAFLPELALRRADWMAAQAGRDTDGGQA